MIATLYTHYFYFKHPLISLRSELRGADQAAHNGRKRTWVESGGNGEAGQVRGEQDRIEDDRGLYGGRRGQQCRMGHARVPTLHVAGRCLFEK